LSAPNGQPSILARFDYRQSALYLIYENMPKLQQGSTNIYIQDLSLKGIGLSRPAGVLSFKNRLKRVFDGSRVYPRIHNSFQKGK